MLAATKWVKEAEAELARASRAAEQKERVCMRMAQKLEEARKTKKAHATLKETQRLVNRACVRTFTHSACGRKG